MDTFKEIQRLRRLCFLSFIEIRHLKKLLVANNIIPKDNLDDYANSLDEYIRELDSKDKLLVKFRSDLSDNPPNH